MMKETKMSERIFVSNDIYLIKNKNGKFIPYLKHTTGPLPIRGFNKKRHLVWRSYKSVSEAKENLRIA
jgi:hypothetical protein